ncbi:MAG: ABC transporter permease [Nonomuraea sp.]|nr:ABC transporter permease [Nonomuraea sp.]
MSSLAMSHFRYQLLEQIRVPIGVAASAFFPAAAMAAFVVPFAGDDPVASTMATGSMTAFGAMSASVIGLGIAVAQARELPWDAYLRTLPAGPFPNFAGRILTTMAISLMSIVPVLLIAAFLTEATTTVPRLLLGVLALLVGSVPFMLLGLLVGYLLPPKAAIAVSQILFFPIAILGGLMFNPLALPPLIAAVSPYVPSRGMVELIWAVTTDAPTNVTAIVMLVVWTVVLAIGAAWAYRRDEGQRFA